MTKATKHLTARGRAVTLALLAVVVSLAGAASASAAPRDFFGVMPQTALTDQDFTRMGQAKVGTLRFQIAWNSIDPSPAAGDTDFSGIDALMTRLAQEGIEPLPFLFGTPVWAAQADGQSCGGSQCVIRAPRTAAGLALWKTFVTEVVDRYGPGGAFWAENPGLTPNPITDWQIWNEQNSDSFYGPKPNVKAYAKLVDVSNTAIDAADPGADVILGGMFGTPRQGRKPAIAAWKFLDKLYAIKGSRKTFEGIGVHPYAAQLTKVIAQVDLFRDAIEDARDNNVEMWVTEIGWGSSGPKNPLVKGKRGQAQRLEDAFDYFLKQRRKLNVKAVVWYSWRDNPESDVGLCAWCPGSGLVTSSLGSKPALKAFTRFTGGS